MKCAAKSGDDIGCFHRFGFGILLTLSLISVHRMDVRSAMPDFDEFTLEQTELLRPQLEQRDERILTEWYVKYRVHFFHGLGP